MNKVHSISTLNNYSKKQLIYLIRELERELIEDEKRFNDQYDILKRFIGEKKSDLILRIEWKQKDDKNTK